MRVIEKLPENAKQVKNALTWVDPDGNFYGRETRMIFNKRTGEKTKHKNYGKYFIISKILNKHNGYVYVGIKYIVNKNKFLIKQRRAHIIIAETFIDNPNKFPVVGHKNNIKSDNRVDNLYWTTVSENTPKAVDDGLLKNDSGYNDSQSCPVVMFDTLTNKEIGRFGSCCEASLKTGIELNTICRQAKYKRPVRRPFYFRFQDDPSICPPKVVV